MKDCFERASDAYEYGDKSEAPGYAAEGHGHAKIDQNGNVVYLRDAWQSHEDYLIDDARKRGSNTHKI